LYDGLVAGLAYSLERTLASWWKFGVFALLIAVICLSVTCTESPGTNWLADRLEDNNFGVLYNAWQGTRKLVLEVFVC